MDIDKLIEMGKNKEFDKLEEERERLFMEFISSVSNPESKRKLEGLHFKMKNLKYKYKNPLVAAGKANSLMMKSFYEMKDRLNELANSFDGKV